MMTPASLTPLDLVRELAKRVECVTKNFMLEEERTGSERAPRIWLQYAPDRVNDYLIDELNQESVSSEISDAPFITIALGGGVINGLSLDDCTCTVAIIVAAYDEGIAMPEPNSSSIQKTGWRIPTVIMWRIINNLARHPLIANTFKLLYPFDWRLETEQPLEHKNGVLWYGLINLTFSLPLDKQNFDFENWDFTNPKLKCDKILKNKE